jgi:hypothetical protein
MNRQVIANSYRPLLPATGDRQQHNPPLERRRRNVACEQCRRKKTRVCTADYHPRKFY